MVPIKRKVVFFVNNASIGELVDTDYYYQDILALQELGFEVVTVFSIFHLPLHFDFLFIWWWSYALIPTLISKLLARPVFITGTFNIVDLPIHGLPSSILGKVHFIKRNLLKAFVISLTARLADNNLFVNYSEMLLAREHLGIFNSSYFPHSVTIPDENLCEYSLQDLGFLVNNDYFLNICWSGRDNLVRKNVYGIIEAFESHAIDVSNTYLVLAGSEGNGLSNLRERVDNSMYSNRIFLMGPVVPRIKNALLRSCMAYIQPSLYEGFGCAVAEAMSFGRPVICSNKGGLNSLAMDACIVVNPYDITSISFAMTQLFNSNTLCFSIGSAGRSRVATCFNKNIKLSRLRTILESYDLMLS